MVITNLANKKKKRCSSHNEPPECECYEQAWSTFTGLYIKFSRQMDQRQYATRSMV